MHGTAVESVTDSVGLSCEKWSRAHENADVPKIIISKTMKLFLDCNQHFGNLIP